MQSPAYIAFALLGLGLNLVRSDLRTMSECSISRIHIGSPPAMLRQASTQNRVGPASCRQFVGDFYAWYVAQSKNGDPLRQALKRKRPNFSAELIRRLNEDYEAAAKSPGEIVGLEFDPVLNSQDFAEKYTPGKVTQNAGRFLVEVFSFYGAKKSDVPAVTPELRNESGRWVFTNFIYKHDGTTDDLLSILKQLKADRIKHPRTPRQVML